MSYYLALIGTKDNPLFTHEFGTSKAGGDGLARFPEAARHLNQFVVHASLDMVEEVQWAGGQMYLKVVDRFYNNYISCFLTGSNVKFLLLHAPTPAPTSGTAGVAARSSSSSSSVAANPTAPATEEAIRQFFTEVFECWVKTSMSPFYRVDAEIKSPVFRQRVVAAGKKYL